MSTPSIERLRIATRRSKLAMWQAEYIKGRLETVYPGVRVELVPMTTRGDRWLSSPLSEIGGKGLFVKELEQAISDGRADVAVHSMKDVPAELPSGFVIPMIAFREDPRDVLVSRSNQRLTKLGNGAVVGSSSLRRRAQLLLVRPDLSITPVRGNVDTRVKKLDDGEYDALVLAAAGLVRLGLAARIAEHLSVDVCLPAAGQGALGIECRADATAVVELLSALNDPEVARCVTAERAVSRALGADCSLPIAAYAVAGRDARIHLKALIASADGKRVVRADATGSNAESVGTSAADALLKSGGDAILEELVGAQKH